MKMTRLEDVLLIVCFCVGISYSVVTNRVLFTRYPELEDRNDDRFSLSTSPVSSRLESDGSCDLKTVLYITQSDTAAEQGAMYYYAVKDGNDWCPSSKGYVSDSSDKICLKIYKEADEMLSWYDANNTCSNETLSSRLVVVDDEPEFQLVQTVMTSEGITGSAYFLGLSETSTDVYTWVDEGSLSFTPPWHSADYSTPESHDCVHIIAGSWKWVKAPCNVTRRFICELNTEKNDYDQLMLL